MGQIISAAAKPKRCNLNQLSQVPTPADGEHILVSSDNSMNAAGQGNFDCYIEGDGTKAATALELKPIETLASELDEQINGGVIVEKVGYSLTSGGYINTASQASLIAGKTYSVESNYTDFTSSMWVYFYSDGTQVLRIMIANLISQGITPASNIDRIQIYSGQSASTGTLEIIFSAEDYENSIVRKLEDVWPLPSKVAELEVEMPTKVTGVFTYGTNMLDINSLNIGRLSATAIVTDTDPSYNYRYTNVIVVKPNTNYYLSTGGGGGLSGNTTYHWYLDADGNIISVVTADTKQLSTPANCVGVRLTILKDRATSENKLMMNEGTSRAEYEEYEEPSFKVPADKIDLKSLANNINIYNLLQKPTILMPSVLYALDGVENSIYHKNYLNFYNPYLWPISGSSSYGWYYRERCFRATSPATPLNIVVYNGETASEVINVNIPVEVGSQNTDNGVKNVNVIGDSMTYNGAWFDEIDDLCPNLAFVGMRKSYGTKDGLYGEGRGGWKLAEYSSPHDDVTATHMQPFSPFVQVDGYNYYGVIEFWAAIVNDNSQYTYGTNGFDKYTSWFGTDGYKLNPSTNDLMYDGTNDVYVYYDGSAWVEATSVTDDSFAFDYSKYIELWNIDSPDFVLIMLGTNDFANGLSDSKWTTWQTRMDALIDSIQSYASSVSKTIIIGLCTSPQAYNSPNNSDHRNPIIGHKWMYDGRSKMIEIYDTSTYKAEGVYLVDTGICLDPEYGFLMQEDKPFVFYEGSAVEYYSRNGVHPQYGYKQLGVCAAGFVQALR